MDLEATDLGVDARFHFTHWMNGRESSRMLALWVADKSESNIRLREVRNTPAYSPAVDPRSGFSTSLCKIADVFYVRYFNCAPLTLVESAKRVLSPDEECGVSRINSNFRRLSLATRTSDSANVDLVTLHVYMEVLRSVLLTVPAPRLLLTDDYLIGKSGPVCPIILAQLNVAMDEYLLRLLKLKSMCLRMVSVGADAYAVLGLTVTATDAEVRKAYRRLAMHAHPDKGGTKELFQSLNEAYEQIMQQRTDHKSHAVEENELLTESLLSTQTDPLLPTQADPLLHTQTDFSVKTLVQCILKAASVCQNVQSTAKECAHACLNASAYGTKLANVISVISGKLTDLSKEALHAGLAVLNDPGAPDLKNRCVFAAQHLANCVTFLDDTDESEIRKNPQPKKPIKPSDPRDDFEDNWELFTSLNMELLNNQKHLHPFTTDNTVKEFLENLVQEHITCENGETILPPPGLAISTDVIVRATVFFKHTFPSTLEQIQSNSAST